MSPCSLLLILGSACLHVVQHLALKRARERTAFVWWMWLWASVLCSPILFICSDHIEPEIWGILVISALIEALYYLSIARAYQSGDLSVVYPLARGTAPLFLFVWTLMWLAERPTIGGVAGIFFIIAGMALINLPRWSGWTTTVQALRTSAVPWALAAGLCISLYTLLDKVAVESVNPFLYTYLAMSLTLLWLTPGAIATTGFDGLKREWHASWLQSALAGISAMAAYAIVLFVMQSGVTASYVGATREVSVVFSTIAAMVLLKEKGTPMRLFGSALISAGVAIIAFLG